MSAPTSTAPTGATTQPASTPKPAAKPTVKRPSGGTSGGKPSGPGFARTMGSRGVSYVQASSARQTAVILIVAILLARLVLTKQLQTFWSQVWGPMKPLGAGLPGKASGSSSSGGSGTTNKPASGGGGSAGSF